MIAIFIARQHSTIAWVSKTWEGHHGGKSKGGGDGDDSQAER